MDTEPYRKKIEKEILAIIEMHLISGDMDAQRARQIAIYILETLKPHMTLDQIQAVAKNFDEHFPELIPVEIQITNDYDNIVKNAVEKHVANLIKQNRIDDANALLKKAIAKEIKLS